MEDDGKSIPVNVEHFDINLQDIYQSPDTSVRNGHDQLMTDAEDDREWSHIGEYED